MSDVTLAGSKLLHYHVAALFRSREEEYEVLQSYIQEGINAGEKAVHICNPQLREEHLQCLERMGIPTDACLRTGQLEVLSWTETYLKEDRFDEETMMALLNETVQLSRAEGFQRVRLVGHMEWASEGGACADRLIEYEALINHCLNRLRQPAICVYDVPRFSGLTILDVLRTHPYTIVDGVLRVNPYYTPPRERLSPSLPARPRS